MANPEHLEILKQGVEAWNDWRVKHYKIIPDLTSADLSGAHLSFINLSGANLNNACFTGANLAYADFSSVILAGADLVNANLANADLSGANLGGAHLNGATLSGANLSKAKLNDADLSEAYLIKTNLSGVNLSGARLYRAILNEAVLSGAILNEAVLSGAEFSKATLTGTDFSGAYLHGASFKGTDLRGAMFDRATIGDTDFGSLDLRDVRGLESILHSGPSEVGISTIYLSEGQIPEGFLRGCGVPESFVVQIPALVAATQPIQFYSCFISYSSTDQEFAERLHSDLQARGVRVWFAPHDLPIGAKIRPAIDESIRLHDKLLLVLSEHSVSSQWVEQEVETAFAREREQEGKVVLFPVRIDDAVMDIKTGWPALLKNTRNVGDFTRWEDHDSYREAFDRLLRDLRAGA